MDRLFCDDSKRSDLDDLVREIDRELDTRFMDELEDAMEAARRAALPDTEPR